MIPSVRVVFLCARRWICPLSMGCTWRIIIFVDRPWYCRTVALDVVYTLR